MNLSDQVRLTFVSSYVKPAREAGHRVVSVAVSDINRALGWSRRFPVICSALIARGFHSEMGVKLINVSGPCPSSSTHLTFQLC